ncbi:hypothetical protein ACS0TY_029689 [Phlomoides rotata]
MGYHRANALCGVLITSLDGFQKEDSSWLGVSTSIVDASYPYSVPVPADLVVDNCSDLVKVVAAPVVGQRTYRDARGPIYDVFIADVRQVGRVDWPGPSSANETSILKPLEYLFYRHLYLYGEFTADRSRPVSPSFPHRLPTRGSIQ